MKRFTIISLILMTLSPMASARNERPDAAPNRGEPVAGEYGLRGDTYTVNPNRVVEYVGPVGFETVVAAGKILTLLGRPEPITVIINSPGGVVNAGETFIQMLQMAKRGGTPIDCLVVGAAYSMGFNVLGECDKIYALPDATFLFHPVKSSTNQPMRAIDALQLASAIDEMDQHYLAVAIAVTHLPPAVVKENYYRETMWTVDMLTYAAAVTNSAPFIIPVSVVRGLPQTAIQYPGRRDYERDQRVRRNSGFKLDNDSVRFTLIYAPILPTTTGESK